METLCRSGIFSFSPIAGGQAVDDTPQSRSAARQSEGAAGGNIVTSKLAFQLSDTDEPNCYVIRLVDRNQVATLAQSEGLSKRIPPG
jgi:hypothetical protein